MIIFIIFKGKLAILIIIYFLKITKMQPLVEDIQPLVEGFLEEYNGIPYRQFFGHEFAYERLGMEDIWNGFYLLNSMIFAAS
jgi:hypothetical protein